MGGLNPPMYKETKHRIFKSRKLQERKRTHVVAAALTDVVHAATNRGETPRGLSVVLRRRQ